LAWSVRSISPALPPPVEIRNAPQAQGSGVFGPKQRRCLITTGDAFDHDSFFFLHAQQLAGVDQQRLTLASTNFTIVVLDLISRAHCGQSGPHVSSPHGRRAVVHEEKGRTPFDPRIDVTADTAEYGDGIARLCLLFEIEHADGRSRFPRQQKASICRCSGGRFRRLTAPDC